MLPIQRSTPAEGSVGGGRIHDDLEPAGHGDDEQGPLFRPIRNNRTGRIDKPQHRDHRGHRAKAIGGTEGFAPSMSPTHPMTHRSHDAGAPWCILASSYGSYPDPHPAARVTWGYLPVTCRLPR